MIHTKTPGECDKASGASEAIYMPSDVFALAIAKLLYWWQAEHFLDRYRGTNMVHFARLGITLNGFVAIESLFFLFKPIFFPETHVQVFLHTQAGLFYQDTRPCSYRNVRRHIDLFESTRSDPFEWILQHCLRAL